MTPQPTRRRMRSSTWAPTVASRASRPTRLGIAAVSARFDNAPGDGQDMVFVLDVRHAQPRLLYTMLLGKGDISTANNVTGSGGDRFDYARVAITPSGQIAASFDDSTTYLDPETPLTSAELPVDNAQGKNEPNLAILQTPISSLPAG
jgi:hypothetical protein